MPSTRRSVHLWLVLACLATGCASADRYPFREKPRAPAPQRTDPKADADLIDLQRELSLYSD